MDQVLHMDRNDYYDGESCSLNLFQVKKFVFGGLMQIESCKLIYSSLYLFEYHCVAFTINA